MDSVSETCVGEMSPLAALVAEKGNASGSRIRTSSEYDWFYRAPPNLEIFRRPDHKTLACVGGRNRFAPSAVDLIARLRENRIVPHGNCTIAYIMAQLPGPLFTSPRAQLAVSKLKNGMSAAEISGNTAKGGGQPNQ